MSSGYMQQTFSGFENVRGAWFKDEVLVTVKAYPNPSASHREISCVAGVRLSDHSWIRLHPIPFRDLPYAQQFSKYSIIKGWLRKSQDPRAESHNAHLESGLERVDWINTSSKWKQRNELLKPLCSPSVEHVRNLERYQQSLALVRVNRLEDLQLIEQDSQWSDKQLAKLRQKPKLFTTAISELEQPPFQFKYKWYCDGPGCNGHDMTIFDWEVIETYRKWSKLYPNDWEERFREKYLDWMRSRDLHFYIGTMLKHPDTWTIVGVYYPPAPN